MAAIVLFCLALLVCIVLRTNILYALLAGLVIFTLYGKKQCTTQIENVTTLHIPEPLQL